MDKVGRTFHARLMTALTELKDGDRWWKEGWAEYWATEHADKGKGGLFAAGAGEAAAVEEEEEEEEEVVEAPDVVLAMI